MTDEEILRWADEFERRAKELREAIQAGAWKRHIAHLKRDLSRDLTEQDAAAAADDAIWD